MRLVHRLIRLAVVGLLFVFFILPTIILVCTGLWYWALWYVGQLGLWYEALWYVGQLG